MQPKALVRAVTGEILTLSHASLEAAFLHAYSPTLEPLWNCAVAPDALGMFESGERFRVFDRTGISSYGVDGTCKHRLDFLVPVGMRVGGVAPISGGVVVAMEHDDDQPVSPPLLIGIDESGAIQWTSAPPMGDVTLLPPADHRTCWRCSYFTGGTLVISGDAVLAVFSDMPRSGLGIGYVLALEDGAFRYTTTMGPIDKVAALGSGEFLVGYAGYGAFETCRYGRDGSICDRWPSQGHYVVRDDDIRVVELRNGSNIMHMARLEPGGTVARGISLDGYFTSEPCVASDGQVLFFRKGLVYAIRDLSASETLPVFEFDDTVFATEMQLGSGCVYVCFTRHHHPWKFGEPLKSDSFLIRVDL